MDWLDRILLRPVEELIIEAVQVRFSRQIVETWGINEDAFGALTSTGITICEKTRLFPNSGVDRSCTKLKSGRSGYVISQVGSANVFLLRKSGHVVGEAVYPQTVAEFFVNSSAEKYVEFCWRYYWLQRELDDYSDEKRVDSALDRFAAWIPLADPMAGDDANASLWPGLVAGWWG